MSLLLLLLHFPFFAPLHAVSVAARSSGADTLRTLHETCATFDLLCRRVGRTVYTGYRDIYLLSHWYANVSSGQGADGRESVREGGKGESFCRVILVGVTFHCSVWRVRLILGSSDLSFFFFFKPFIIVLFLFCSSIVEVYRNFFFKSFRESSRGGDLLCLTFEE